MTANRDAENFALRAHGCRGKKRHRTKQLAKQNAKLTARLGGIKLRIYKCPVCLGYHLTSDTERRPVWAR